MACEYYLITGNYMVTLVTYLARIAELLVILFLKLHYLPSGNQRTAGEVATLQVSAALVESWNKIRNTTLGL